MFTGIIEEVGVVEGVTVRADVARIDLRASEVSETALGDSIAVNGACLTVTAVDGDRLSFDAVRETLDKTSLGSLEAGSRVNLERAMRAGGRLDGHIVQGHVDGVGQVERWERRGDDVRLFISCPPEIAGYLVDKGSVTIEGVSLTVVSARPEGFEVVLIPHTLAETTLGELEAGAVVNLEVDVLGKYVKTYLERHLASNDGAR